MATINCILAVVFIASGAWLIWSGFKFWRLGNEAKRLAQEYRELAKQYEHRV